MKPRHSSPRLSSLSPNQALIASAVLAALAMPAAAQGPLQFQELPRMVLPVDSDRTDSVALGDVDGDGDLDMVFGNAPAGNPLSGGQNRLYRNDGAGSFTDVTASQMPVDNDTTNSVALGDVDGDGDLDMVIGNGGYGGGQQNRLYLNDGTGTFSDVSASQMPSVGGSVALGDVDGDGDLDLVIGNVGQNRLCLNDGTGTFSDATASQMPVDNDHTSSVALGDVDGDGDLDMVIGNLAYQGWQNRLYLNNGAGSFSDATASQMPVDSDYTNSVALGDVDGDGDLDMVIGNRYQNRLYLNDGAGTFTDATASQVPSANRPTRSVALGDVDGDGDLDMVIGNDGWGNTAGWGFIPAGSNLYLNDGTGTFADATASRLPGVSERTNAVALGDVDGDGDLDMVVGNEGWSNVFFSGTPDNRLYLNLQRQLHAPAEPRLGLLYRLDAYLRYGPPSTVDLAAVYLSTAPASIALPPFGTVGIDLTMASPFPTLAIPQPAGVGTVSLTVPNVAGLIGQAIYSQAVLFANPSDLRLSNVVRDVIQ